MKKLILLIILLLTSACANNDAKLKVGVPEGPQKQIVEFIDKTQMPLDIIVFKDYNKLNIALKENKIQLNLFQNKIYLEQNNSDDELVAIAKSYISPMGIYSSKYQKLEELPKKPLALIPNDDIGKLRATNLLQKKGLTNASILQIDLNKPLPQTADIILLPLEYATKNNFSPDKALAKEDTLSAFTQLIVTNKQNQSDPKVTNFLKAYKSEQTKEYVKTNFPNLILPD